jgi:hypothetical protein
MEHQSERRRQIPPAALSRYLASEPIWIAAGIEREHIAHTMGQFAAQAPGLLRLLGRGLSSVTVGRDTTPTPRTPQSSIQRAFAAASLVAAEPLFPERSQRRIPQSRHITFAFSGGGNNPLGYDLLDHGRLPGVVQFPACRIKGFAHNAGGRIVEDAPWHELKNGAHADSHAGEANPNTSA